MVCTVAPTVLWRNLSCLLCARGLYTSQSGVRKYPTWLYIILCLNAVLGVPYKMLSLLRWVGDVSPWRWHCCWLLRDTEERFGQRKGRSKFWGEETTRVKTEKGKHGAFYMNCGCWVSCNPETVVLRGWEGKLVRWSWVDLCQPWESTRHLSLFWGAGEPWRDGIIMRWLVIVGKRWL